MSIKIVTLCGSVRFPEAFRIVGQAEALLGNVVFGPWSFVPVGQLTGDLLRKLREAHDLMIARSDEVVVVKVRGREIGEGTRSEMNFAHSLGKPVRIVEVAP